MDMFLGICWLKPRGGNFLFRQCYLPFKGCNPKAVEIESPGDWFIHGKLKVCATGLSDPWIAYCWVVFHG